jgi:Fe-S cluster assembly ATP-binding protein
MASTLEIKDLHVSVEGKEILKGVDLTFKQGEIHALMGPNGSGKSTLAFALMGHPKYEITKGDILFNGESILGMSTDERARKGLFLAFQNPFEIDGVRFSQFLMSALRAKANGRPFSVFDYNKMLDEKMQALGLDKSFAQRFINVGFSGGEKKKAEILQMAVMQPEIAILDETDSGLDIDSLRVVANVVNKMRSPSFGAIVITHYQRLLNYLEPDIVHIFIDGRVAQTGRHELVEELEKTGYSKFMKMIKHSHGQNVASD